MKHSYRTVSNAKSKARMFRDAKTSSRTASAGKAAATTQVTVKGARWRELEIAPGGLIEVDASLLTRVVNEMYAIDALGAAMASAPEPVSPELARSLQAQENWWRKIEREFPSLSSREVAELLGAKSTNRNFASQQRRAGKLLGYTRRHAALFPVFQFDQAKGLVRPVIPQLLEVTRRHNVPDEDVVLWMVAYSSLFPEQDRPVDHMDDPEALLSAAEIHFGAIW